jgi:hypothetical protein
MKTEARKSFRHGFNLTEQELRRIVDTISQQFSRVAPSAQLKFEAKLRNGTLVESSSVDDVLSFENVDSRQIVRLELDVRDSEPSPKWLVHIQFANSKDDDGAINRSDTRFAAMTGDGYLLQAQNWTNGWQESNVLRGRKSHAAHIFLCSLYSRSPH